MIVNAIQKNAHTLYDLAIVSGVLENLEKPQGRQLLASLRDRLSRQYCVHVAIDNRDTVSQWSLTDFLSMALVRVNTYSLRDSSFVLFKYSIGSYKRTPDWLNANNWANPEFMGKVLVVIQLDHNSRLPCSAIISSKFSHSFRLNSVHNLSSSHKTMYDPKSTC